METATMTLRVGDRVQHKLYLEETGTVTAVWYPKHTETKNVRRNGRWRTAIKWRKGEQVTKIEWDAYTKEKREMFIARGGHPLSNGLRGWIRSANLTRIEG